MSEIGQYVFNGLMLGMIYAMVAVGFTLFFGVLDVIKFCLLYTSPSPRDRQKSRMPSSA